MKNYKVNFILKCMFKKDFNIDIYQKYIGDNIPLVYNQYLQLAAGYIVLVSDKYYTWKITDEYNILQNLRMDFNVCKKI